MKSKIKIATVLGLLFMSYLGFSQSATDIKLNFAKFDSYTNLPMPLTKIGVCCNHCSMQFVQEKDLDEIKDQLTPVFVTFKNGNDSVWSFKKFHLIKKNTSKVVKPYVIGVRGLFMLIIYAKGLYGDFICKPNSEVTILLIFKGAEKGDKVFLTKNLQSEITE